MNASDWFSSVMEYYPHVERKRVAILRHLAKDHTPLFLCERDNLVDRYRALEQSLQTRWRRSAIGYSFKTNYLVARSGILRDLGAWAEVVSGHEYHMARGLGYPGEAIVLNGPCKADELLRLAIAERSLVNINDHDELDRLLGIARLSDNPMSLGMRISSQLPCGGLSRFGFSLQNAEASEALAKIRRASNVHLIGLHTHLYGDTDDPEYYSQAARTIGQFAAQQIPDYQQTLRFIDMGGGFPAHSPKPKSRQTWDPRPIDVYIGHLTDALRPFFSDEAEQPTLIVEPGRYLTCDGILLVTRVIHVKERDGRQIINCNGSISMLPLTHYCPQIIRPYTCDLYPRGGAELPSAIFGATCRENDLLYEGLFPQVECGDYLVHFAAGAYNSSLSPEFIFANPAMELI